MKHIQKFVLLSLLASTTYAGTNPIQYSVLQAFPSQVLPTASYIAIVEFKNNMPFDMASPFTIERSASPANQFSFDDRCSGKKLRRSESCRVTIYLTPTTEGSKTIQFIEAYGHDRVPLPALSTFSTGGSSGPNITGNVPTKLPLSLDINASAAFEFTYTNDGLGPATGITIAVAGAQYNTNCKDTLGSTPPGNTCYVRGTFTSPGVGIHTINSILTYTQGSPVPLETFTETKGDAGGLVCSPAVPFAPQTLINTEHPVTLLCTNKTGKPINITGHVATYPTTASQGIFIPDPSGGDNCTPQTLAADAACQLKGKYSAPPSAVNNVMIGLQVSYKTEQSQGLSSSTSTSTQVVTKINNIRTIHLKNECNFPVWWSMVGGAVASPASCQTQGDCPLGSTCNLSAKLCYFNNYGPTQGNYMLGALTGEATTQISETAASLADGNLWKGLISASTNCQGISCKNNACGNNGGATSCTAGVGFSKPSTVAEFTLKLAAASAVDSYDVSQVDGFSFPMSMGTNQAAARYNCGTAGNPKPAGDLKACHFNNITPPSPMYFWVSDTGIGCTAQNTCSNSEQVCGLAFSNSKNNFVKRCGDYLGYWTADSICGTVANFESPFGDPFKCNLSLDAPFPLNTYTLTQLLKCSPPNSTAPLFNSCYLSYTGYSKNDLKQCCGCSDWEGIATPTAQCPIGQINPQWTALVEDKIKWMKEACPTAYAYPYDDKASSFQCEASELTEYTITFCPGGETGLPSGKKDGRQTS